MEFSYDITEMSPQVLRVIIYNNEEEMGVLFFERAKKTFATKPISMDQWVCVDAKVTGNIYDAGDLTPRDVVNLCQVQIREAGL